MLWEEAGRVVGWSGDGGRASLFEEMRESFSGEKKKASRPPRPWEHTFQDHMAWLGGQGCQPLCWPLTRGQPGRAGYLGDGCPRSFYPREMGSIGGRTSMEGSPDTSLFQCLWCNENKACMDYPVRKILPPASLCKLSSARWGVCWGKLFSFTSCKVSGV